MTETLDMFTDLAGTLVANSDASSVLLAPSAACSSSFQGNTFSPKLDQVRLTGQLKRVRDYLESGEWKTLTEISKATGDPEASCSARIRDLRKPSHGFYTVDRRRRTVGQWEYQLRGSGL